MPAHRKPPDQRQDNRKARTLVAVPAEPTENYVPAEPTENYPAPNPHWSGTTMYAWRSYWLSGVANAAEAPDEYALARLFDMRNRQEAAWIRYDMSPYVEGSKGQPVANPALADALALERAIVALEDRYALSPKARAALGLAFGQAALTAADLNAMTTGGGDARDDDVAEADGWEVV